MNVSTPKSFVGTMNYERHIFTTNLMPFDHGMTILKL